MAFADLLPPLNATLNGASAVCIFLGWRAIRAGRPDLHRRCMLTALGFSATFLVFYLIRVSLTGAHRYPVSDWTKPVYLAVLGTHTLLAATVPYLVGRAVFLALKQRLPEHRRIVRFTLPIWGYVSATGVVIYLMLYQVAPSRLPPSLTSCAEPLGDIWRVAGEPGHAFDIRDTKAGIHVYPLWNTAGPDASPWRIELLREGAHVGGELSMRIERPGRTCPVRQPATLTGCTGSQATLSMTLVDVDAACAVAAAAPVTLQLNR